MIINSPEVFVSLLEKHKVEDVRIGWNSDNDPCDVELTLDDGIIVKIKGAGNQELVFEYEK